MLAKLANWTFPAFWRSCRAGVSAKLHDAVAKIRLFFRGDDTCKDKLYLFGIAKPLAVHSKPAANAHTVSVGNYCWLAVNISKQKICDLSANAGKGQQSVHVVGNYRAEFVPKLNCRSLYACRLGLIKTAGANDIFNVLNGRVGKVGICGIFREKLTADYIDPRVGALRRKPTHNEKPPGLTLPVKGADRLGIDALKLCDDSRHSFFFLIFRHFFAEKYVPTWPPSRRV